MGTSADTPGPGATPGPGPLTWHQTSALRTLVRTGRPMTPHQVHPSQPVVHLEGLVARGLATRSTIPGTNHITYTATPAGRDHAAKDGPA